MIGNIILRGREVASHLAHNQKIPGAIPGPATNFILCAITGKIEAIGPRTDWFSGMGKR